MLSRADLERLVLELGPALAGATCERIWRDGPDLFVILFRTGETDLALEIGLRPESARVVARRAEDLELDDPAKKKERKADTHFFLTRLRRSLPALTLEGIALVPGDRIVLLDLARPEPGTAREAPEQGSPERPRLVVELTGRSTNLLLVDRGAKVDQPLGPQAENGVILLALRPGRGGRELDPGKQWLPPRPRIPRNPTEEAKPADPPIAPDIDPDPTTLALSDAVSLLAHEIEEGQDASDRRTALLKAATQAEKRARGLLAKLEKERDDARAAEELRRRGELLKANAARVAKGATSLRVQDYYASEPREIELEIDPLVPVMDQARALFKRAKKLDRGLVAIETRLGQVDGEVEALAKVTAELESLAGAEGDREPALDRLEKALEKLGCAPRPPAEAKAKPRKAEPRGPRKFFSREGFEILVGRSNQENDRLTITIARGNDFFFHVRGYPGSHVILRSQKEKSVPLETLLDAAALAVHYSKVRGNLRADVSYTPRKYVRKPRGAKPGLVEIANEKTIRPDGDPERLARLLATAGGREADDDAEVEENE